MSPSEVKMSGQVEADETFIGGKARNMHPEKKARKITGTGGKDKTAVMGILELKKTRAPSTNTTGKRAKTVALREQTERLRSEFMALAKKWRAETCFSSSLDEKVLNDCYQSIIAMGKPAVPLVLSELKEQRGHWFWALHFMTGVDPVPEGANIDQARDAWLAWGRGNGLLK